MLSITFIFVVVVTFGRQRCSSEAGTSTCSLPPLLFLLRLTTGPKQIVAQRTLGVLKLHTFAPRTFTIVLVVAFGRWRCSSEAGTSTCSLPPLLFLLRLAAGPKQIVAQRTLRVLKLHALASRKPLIWLGLRFGSLLVFVKTNLAPNHTLAPRTFTIVLVVTFGRWRCSTEAGTSTCSLPALLFLLRLTARPEQVLIQCVLGVMKLELTIRILNRRCIHKRIVRCRDDFPPLETNGTRRCNRRFARRCRPCAALASFRPTNAAKKMRSSDLHFTRRCCRCCADK